MTRYIATVLNNRQKRKAPKGATVEVVHEGEGHFGPYVLAVYQGEKIYLNPKNVERVGDLSAEREAELDAEREAYRAAGNAKIKIMSRTVKVARSKKAVLLKPVHPDRAENFYPREAWMPVSQIKEISPDLWEVPFWLLKDKLGKRDAETLRDVQDATVAAMERTYAVVADAKAMLAKAS